MIEPTETESPETLAALAEALEEIAAEARCRRRRRGTAASGSWRRRPPPRCGASTRRAPPASSCRRSTCASSPARLGPSPSRAGWRFRLPSGDRYLRMLTTRATTRAPASSEIDDWQRNSSFVQRASGIVSVGLKAVALVNDV